jgi:hypothetical protein
LDGFVEEKYIVIGTVFGMVSNILFEWFVRFVSFLAWHSDPGIRSSNDVRCKSLLSKRVVVAN